MRGTRRSIAFAALAMVGMLCGNATWAQDQITVVRGDENYPPYEMVVNGQLTGVHVDIVNAAAASIGVKVVWQSFPWKRALLMLRNGEADGITYIGKTPEREAWAIFLDDNQISVATTHFIVLKKNAGRLSYNGDLSRFLDHHPPIVLRGFSYGKESFDKVPLIETNSLEQMVGMLKAGRSDVAMVNWFYFVRAFKDKQVLSEVMPLQPPVSMANNYIAFSAAKKEQALAQRFGVAIKAYKATPAYPALLKRYGIAP